MEQTSFQPLTNDQSAPPSGRQRNPRTTVIIWIMMFLIVGGAIAVGLLATRSQDSDPCAAKPCQNGGTCSRSGSHYSCKCKPGFAGPNCEINLDECASSPCQHGGVCIDGIDSFVCECRAGYTSAWCETAYENRITEKLEIDLDLAPRERWKAIYQSHAAEWTPLMAQLLQFIKSILTPTKYTFWKEHCVEATDSMTAQHEYLEEMRGIADVTGLDINDICVTNALYDLFHSTDAVGEANERTLELAALFGCTSIVAQDAHNEILHGRNLDLFQPDLMKNGTIQVNFKRGTRLIFSGVFWLTNVGSYTGMHYRSSADGAHSWGITQNTRFVDSQVNNATFTRMLEGGWVQSLFVRHVLQTQSSFNDAVDQVQHTRLASGSYLTLSGESSGQGVVVSRTYNTPADVWYIQPSSRYALGQTNDDHWAPDTKDPRRAFVDSVLVTYDSHNITLHALYSKILTIKPDFVPATLYHTLMNPHRDDFANFKANYKP